MHEQFTRTALLIGEPAIKTLADSHVAVFGVGGVGSFVAEALARSGVGEISLFDDDTISTSNINRQIIALHSTIGKEKTQVMRERILDINPNAIVHANTCFYTSENASMYDLSKYDYVVDAIDTVSSKLTLIERSVHKDIPIISSMGTGNKLDASLFQIADISKTSVCPLARVMRRELKNRHIEHVKVLYSQEMPQTPNAYEHTDNNATHQKRQTPGSMSFVPPVAGMMIAGEVVRDLIDI